MAHKVFVASRRHLVSFTDGHHLVATLRFALMCELRRRSRGGLEEGQGLQGCASNKKKRTAPVVVSAALRVSRCILNFVHGARPSSRTTAW
jgi:hypothetical protein